MLRAGVPRKFLRVAELALLVIEQATTARVIRAQDANPVSEREWEMEAGLGG
jgi:hypothetical protein